jgi:hypothetical protein
VYLVSDAVGKGNEACCYLGWHGVCYLKICCFNQQ